MKSVAGMSLAALLFLNPICRAEDLAALRMQATLQEATKVYCAQLLGELDRPVGDGIKMLGISMPSKLNEKGQLELDVKGDGKFRQMPKREVLSVELKADSGKTQAVKVLVTQLDDKSWVYRNVTQLLIGAGPEQFVVVDANGNGVYNEAGVDGMAWQNEVCLFPLPAADERWCSAKQEFIGLKFGPWGEEPAMNGKPLATASPATLPMLKGVNEERVMLGLPPRPEDTKLSAELHKHIMYMCATGKLSHDQDKNHKNYSPDGAAAGIRGILSMGAGAAEVASNMTQTYFHRQDVIRPNTMAFGVAYEGRFGGIDGRASQRAARANDFPVLCPMPGQSGLPTTYAKEGPDATPGDNAAGYPITVYFGTNKLKLTSYSLKAVGAAGAVPAGKTTNVAAANIDCYPYDPKTGASQEMTSFCRCVCIIAKDPLKSGVEYEVAMTVEVDGKPWSKTWRFSTGKKR